VSPKSESGFTLLEVMVAMVIMGLAIVGLLSNLHVSLRNTAQLTGYDRATVFAQHKMDELLTAPELPSYQVIRGPFDPGNGDPQSGGWQALARPWEYPPNAGAGEHILQRVELEIFWNNGDRRRSFTLEGFREAMLTQAAAQQLPKGPSPAQGGAY
jgi:prepilin-type N-terminal cleavage/methylation domain-containing protein